MLTGPPHVRRGSSRPTPRLYDRRAPAQRRGCSPVRQRLTAGACVAMISPRFRFHKNGGIAWSGGIMTNRAKAALVAAGVVLPAVLGFVPSYSAERGGSEEVTILRDDFGTPNIFAETEAGAVFGAGYAQAEDRLEELFKQYRRCEGTMSEAFGPKYLKDDYRQRVWR